MSETIKCPFCGGEFDLTFSVRSKGTEVEQYLRETLLQFLRGYPPSKGYVKKVDRDTYEFYLQIYDSPEGDTWISGTVYWCPPYRFEVRDLKYSDY